MSNSKSAKRDRPETGKWWFELNNSTAKIFVRKRKGALTVNGQEMAHVTAVAETSDTSSIKVTFSNISKGVKLGLGKFDFLANDFSKQFVGYTTSSLRFAERFRTLEGDKSQTMHETPSLAISAVDTDVEKQGGSKNVADEPSPQAGKRKRGLEDNETPPSSKLKEIKEDDHQQGETDGAFIEKVKKMFCIPGSFNVLTTSLVPPRPEFKLRELDKNYVEILKNELLRCPLSFAKPLIGIVKGLKSKEEFDENVIDTYEIEIIGGNHRRQALTEITREEISRETKLEPYEQTTVQLYSEMPTIDALRLAQLHNHIDKMNHEVTTREKVTLCRNLLKNMFGDRKTLAWRKTCESVLGESIQSLDLVFFLCGLNDRISELVDSILQKYGRLELMGQKVSSKVLKKLSTDRNQQPTVDCPVSKFKCLRGKLTDEEIECLLLEVEEGKMSFAGLEKECRRLKEMKELQCHLIEQAGCKTWEEARKRFPTWTTDDKLQTYRGQIKSSPERFNFFISSMLKWEEATKHLEDSGPDLNQIVYNKGVNEAASVFLLCQDVVSLTNTTVSGKVKQFEGSTLIFLNLQKDWNKSSIEKIIRNLKAINNRNDTGRYRVVIFPHEQSPYGQLSAVREIAAAAEMTFDVAYYHDKSKEIKENTVLTKTITPFGICATEGVFPRKINSGDLFSFDMCKTEKPWELYKSLIDTFNEERGWILDLCSASGSVAKASLKLGKNCVVVDSNEETLLNIRQSLEQDVLAEDD